MSFELFVDPGELKKDSRFIRCPSIRTLNLIPAPGLEEMTGADVMLSFGNLPGPSNEMLLKLHLENGALLIQLKFGHDLIASIIDGRFAASQAKMLATGARADQIILLFIGLVFEPENKNKELMINGQYVRNIVPQAINFKFAHYLEQRIKWALRGGIFEHIVLESSLVDWITSVANVLENAKNEPVRRIFEPRQSLELISDWRNLLANLPGIGEVKAMAIYNWLEDKSFYGFLAALEDRSLANVPGIGLGTIEKITKYLKGE